MKLVLTLFLGLMTSQSFSEFPEHPAKLLSQVCGNRYVQGTKLKLSNGQIFWMCLSKDALPDVYATDIRSSCHSTHTETIWVFSNNQMHFKECVLTSELGNQYWNAQGMPCANGYKADLDKTYIDVIFKHKACVITYEYELLENIF